MVCIGIDLGTTSSLGALVYDDGPHVIPRRAGTVVPSAVAFDGPPEARPPLVGQEADRDLGAVRSIKRLMGRTWDEALREGSQRFFPPGGQQVRLARRGSSGLGLEIDLQGERRFFWPHEISAFVLRRVRCEAERGLGRIVDRAVITVPASFEAPHRKATLEAARLAGLDVSPHDLLDEPTAAALAFARVAGFERGECVLVADWGGGALDVTVQRCDGPGWTRLAAEGDLSLGGDDIDDALAAFVLRESGLPEGLLRDERNAWRLRREARRVKELLSSSAEAGFACGQLQAQDGGLLAPLARSVTHTELGILLAPLLQRAEDALERCLDQVAALRRQIRKILLVGGSSRIPAFQGTLRHALPGARLLDDVDPERSVALGAALYANARPPIARISPFSYAVRDLDGMERPLIPAGSEVPTPETERFMFAAQTRYPGQTVYRVTLVEKEDPPPSASLAVLADWDIYHPGTCHRLFARGVPATLAGTRVDVEVWLDEYQTLQAACHLAGQPRPFPMTRGACGSDATFTHLLGLQLEAEALVEANPDERKGLLPQMAAVLPQARAAESERDREQAEQSIRRLSDLHEQVAVHQRDRIRTQRLGDHRRMSLLSWVSFYEQKVLPALWDVIPESPRAAAVEAIRAIRVMEQTGAPLLPMQQHFNQLQDTLMDSAVGLPVQALHWAEVLGVPKSLASSLRENGLRLRDARLKQDQAAWETESAVWRLLLDQTQRVWAPFRETETFLDASPDLVLGAPGGGERGN
jgi:molecular chaperone DnaK (HSP70)